MGRVAQTAVGLLIVVTSGVWILELIGDPAVLELLAATPRSVGGGHLYKLLTSVFAHSTTTIFHVIFNMLFLYVFGRELEAIYGKRGFIVFYLVAGTVAILAEIIALGASGSLDARVYGASGAVLGVVVLFTLYYPNRQILFIFIPMPVWVLCLIFIAWDVIGALGRGGDGIAHVAHLAGAAVGFLYWYAGARTRSWGGPIALWKRLRGAPRRGRPAPIIPMPRREDPTTRQISLRIDELLAKISATGMDSLTEEERSFLRENAGRYRS